jgi:hypothetical protein
MDTRRSFFTFTAALLGFTSTARSLSAQTDAHWTSETFAYLAMQGANLSIDIQGWDFRQLFALVKIASQHGSKITLRSAAVLTPQQAAGLAGPTVTFEM